MGMLETKLELRGGTLPASAGRFSFGRRGGKRSFILSISALVMLAYVGLCWHMFVYVGRIWGSINVPLTALVSYFLKVVFVK